MRPVLPSVLRRLVMGLGLSWVLLGPLAPAATLAEQASLTEGPLTIAKQGSFFIGGREESSTSLGRGKSAAAPGTITVDQVYVRYQTPPRAEARPNVVLIHGCCLTGKTWETTPDGRMGWDEYFVRRGFSTYILDQAWRGRSASDPSAINAVANGGMPIESLPLVSSASHEGSWVLFRFGPRYGEAFPGLKFPVNAVDELWRQMVPDYAGGLPKPNPTVPALTQLAERIGPSVLISHSQSGIYPFQALVSDRRNIAAIISIEPANCPDPKTDLTPYKGTPILVLFGDYIGESPGWGHILQGCRDYVDAMKVVGGRADLLVLPETGIKGNSHMLMQDSNSLQIAGLLVDWIRKLGR
jgi:hypothetical protein